MGVRSARWLPCVAVVAALGLAQASIRPAAPPPAPLVIGPSPDPVREEAAAKASARRFLDLYAAAADGHLSGAERHAIMEGSASQVAELLVEQPPDKLRSGGRLVHLAIEPDSQDGFSAVGMLTFRGVSELARMTIDRYPDGSWRVTTFNPTVAAPNRGARH